MRAEGRGPSSCHGGCGRRGRTEDSDLGPLVAHNHLYDSSSKVIFAVFFIFTRSGTRTDLLTVTESVDGFNWRQLDDMQRSLYLREYIP